MPQSIPGLIRELQQMTVRELRDKWLEVYGEPTRSHNKVYLWKRIAWRIQVNMEGGLSDRAKERARELAREADIRLRPPSDAFDSAAESVKVKMAVPGRRRDPRLPAPGTILSREYRGQQIHVQVNEDNFEYEGRPYRSLSAISKAITGAHWNGFLFFNLDGHNGGKRIS